MLAVGEPEEELRKSIYSKQNNPQHKRWFLDRIGDKIGSENVAYIMMTFSTSVFPLGFLYSNENNFNICETFLVRSIAVISINVIIARYFHMDITFRDPTNFRLLFIRNFCITIQGIMFTLAQFYLAQPIVQTINTTGFLFVFFVDYLINGVTITRKQFYGVIFGVIGVLITINGQFIIKKIDPNFETRSDFKNYLSDDPVVKLTVAFFFIIGNIIWAYAQIITKRIHGMNAIQINVHLGIFFLFTTGMVYPSQVQKPVELSKFLMGILAGGVVMTIGQITFIGATTMTKNTGVLTMFGLVSVIVGYIVSVFKYNEAINPICILGAAFIVIGLSRIAFKDKAQQEALTNK